MNVWWDRNQSRAPWACTWSSFGQTAAGSGESMIVLWIKHKAAESQKRKFKMQSAGSDLRTVAVAMVRGVRRPLSWAQMILPALRLCVRGVFSTINVPVQMSNQLQLNHEGLRRGSAVNWPLGLMDESGESGLSPTNPMKRTKTTNSQHQWATLWH